MEEKAHILVVDDDDRLRALLKRYLGGEGFMVTEASDAAEAKRRIGWYMFDAMVLDVMMPGQTGLELLSELGDSAPPTLMLSAMGEVDDRISGLERGAEDYLTKPFEPKELTLRIRTILRRHQGASEILPMRFGAFLFDPQAGQLKKGDELVALTSTESALLKLLSEQAGKPVSREELSQKTGGTERSIDVQVTRLRKKLGDEGPLHLQTVRGAGYVLYAQKAGSA